MNLIRKLFGGPQKAGGSGSANWAGQSGKIYPYHVYPIGTSFKSVPATYIYARQSEEGSWIPVYIAQTRDLHQRLEGYAKQECALLNGATHIHVHLSTQGQAARCEEERDLVLHWQPVCNDAPED